MQNKNFSLLFQESGIFGWFFGFFSSLVCRIELILFPLLLYFSPDRFWYPYIGFTTTLFFGPIMGIFKFWGSMWRVKTVTKFKNSFSPILIYWNDNRIHLGIIKKLNFPIWFPPLLWLVELVKSLALFLLLVLPTWCCGRTRSCCGACYESPSLANRGHLNRLHICLMSS